MELKVFLKWIVEGIRCYRKDNKVSEHIEGWNSYNEIKDKFEPIDEKKSKNSDELLNAIDAFYSNEDKVSELLKDKSLLYRKAHLENNISESGLFKEIKVVFLSALFSIFISKIFDMAVPTGKGNVLLALYIGAAAVTFIIILINILCTLEKAEQQVDRYEIAAVDKVLENRGLSGKMFLVEFEDGKKSLVIHK